MPIPVICPCGAKLRVKDELRGKQIKCPQCNELCKVGADSAVAAVPATAVGDQAAILAGSGFSDFERERLQKEMRKDEKLVWAAKPVTRLPFLLGCAAASALFFMGGVVGFVSYQALAERQGIDTFERVLRMAPLVVAGAVIAFGLAVPFMLRRRYRHTCYAITTKRALAWDGRMLGRTRFHDYEPADLARIAHQDFSFGAASGVGHLAFATEVTRTRDGQRLVSRWHGFFYVRHHVKVEKLLRQHLVDPYLAKLYE